MLNKTPWGLGVSSVMKTQNTVYLFGYIFKGDNSPTVSSHKINCTLMCNRPGSKQAHSICPCLRSLYAVIVCKKITCDKSVMQDCN